MLNQEWVDVIDRDNRVVGSVPRATSYAQKLSHRIVHVMAVQDGRVYLIRRGETVRYLPGFFCTSAGGHVSAGEKAETAALREMQEEIGLEGSIRLITEFFFTHEFDVHVSVYVKEVRAGLDRSQFHPQLEICLKSVFHFLSESGEVGK